MSWDHATSTSIQAGIGRPLIPSAGGTTGASVGGIQTLDIASFQGQIQQLKQVSFEDL